MPHENKSDGRGPLLGTWDVVVVGGGGSGLAAAVTAADEGASVVVLEKNPYLGGTTSIAVGSLTAARTSLQKMAGIEDDFDEHVEDMLLFRPEDRNRANLEIQQVLAREAANTLDWLQTLGVQFAGPFPEPPNRVPRMHNVIPSAKAYIAALQRKALSLGVTIHTGIAVKSLLANDSGRVTGVRVVRNGEAQDVQARRGVILAAGDYSNSHELKRLFVDEEIANVEGINPTATGDGHQMGMELGAEAKNMDLILGPQIRFVPPPRKPFGQLLPANPTFAKLAAGVLKILPQSFIHWYAKSLLVTWQAPELTLFESGAALVNQEGNRFVDETGSRRELAIPAQTDKVGTILFDGRIAEKFSEWPNFISTAPDIAYAYVKDYRARRPDIYHESATISGLARSLQVDAANLQSAINELNKAEDEGSADAFGRTDFAGGLRKPPYYALGPAKAWIVHADGGLNVNTDCHILREDGTIIEGLYGAGSNAQSGMILWGHGLHIAWAFTSGRIAGRAAAKADAVD